MIAAVAFRVHSWQANIFRRWLIDLVAQSRVKLQIPAVLVPVREQTLAN
jgi:hypothetical protein